MFHKQSQYCTQSIHLAQEGLQAVAGSIKQAVAGSTKQVVAGSTKHGKDKFNAVPFLCNYSISTILNNKFVCKMFIYSSHIFQPQFLAIFTELVALLMCAVYMSTYLVTVCRYGLEL